MRKATSLQPASTARLILLPALISLAATCFRLVGELQHWPEKWFSTGTSGITPSGTNWLVGITWLALPFGIYFALKLAAAGETPARPAQAIGLAVLGVTVMLIGLRLIVPLLPIPFPAILLFIWLAMAVAAAIQMFGWPALFKTLLAYGVSARLPVVLVMFLAMLGNWGTHYDYVGMPEPFQMSLWRKFFWLAFFPQLIFWIGFTIVTGSLTGTVAVVIRQSLKKS